MNIKDQVLSIDQVRELQELGFDVEKYASITKFSCENCENFGDCAEEIGSDIYMDINYVCDSIKGYKTLTIGDIIEVLPKKIIKGNSTYVLHISYIHNSISIYYDVEQGVGTHFFVKTVDLIYGLFETLKWCIKEKHIGL